MNTLTKVIAVFLLGLALALGVAAYRLANAPAPEPVQRPELEISAVPESVSRPQPMHDVVVASRDLKAGEVLHPEALEVRQWPQVPGTGFVTVQELEGRVVKLPVAKGEVVMQAWLAQGLASYLQHDQRALSIPVDEISGAGNTITPGDMVDVFFTLNKDRDQVEDTQARLLLSAVQVLAYGDQSVDGPVSAGEESSSGRGGTGARAARVAILAVPLKEVNDMLLAVRSGALQLVLRAPDDLGHPDRELFPERRPVLTEKAGLSAEQRAALRGASNQAYAGVSLPGLSAFNQRGDDAQPTESASPSSPGISGRRLQVIRGSHIQSVQY